MARRVARAEGSTADVEPGVIKPSPTTGRLADPAPGDNGEALSRLVEFFRAQHPDTWETLRLCPLQHGIDVMIEALKQD